jgi:hypothetical protein
LYNGYDAIYAQDLPRAALPIDGDVYAGYVDGDWPDFAEICKMFPQLSALDHVLGYTTGLDSNAEFIDIENGDATPEQAVDIWYPGASQKFWRPGNYIQLSNFETLVELYADRGVEQYKCRFITAHWNGVPHVCGPNTGCSRYQADGTQWAMTPSYDSDQYLDNFFISTSEHNPTGGKKPTVADNGLVITPMDEQETTEGGTKLGSPVTCAFGVPGVYGYWLVTAEGGVYNFGPDAKYHGSVPERVSQGIVDKTHAPIVAAFAATNNGYHLVGQDGTIHSFGDAQFHGDFSGRKS